MRTTNKTTEVSLLPLVTLALWSGCLLIGGIGFLLGYPEAPAPHPTIPVTQATLLNVELTKEPVPQPRPAPVMRSALPPEMIPVSPEQPSISLLPVAEPNLVAFALPVEGPQEVVPVKAAASSSQGVSTNKSAAPPVQQITFGQGEGKQPAPEYPYQSVRAGQEGRVGVQFRVDESGRVQVAEVVSPSPWPLLNQAAAKTIRDRWRFPAGPERNFEVIIRFELNK